MESGRRISRGPLALTAAMLLCLLCALLAQGRLARRPWPKIEGVAYGVDFYALQRRLSGFRGLRFEAPIPLYVRTPAEVHARYLRYLEKDKAEWARYIAMLHAFHLISEDADWGLRLTEYNSKRVAAYYDPEESLAVVVDEAPDVEADEGERRDLEKVLYHELDHALQHQHYGYLDESTRAVEHRNDDADLAHRALLEGDATWTMDAMEGIENGRNAEAEQNVEETARRFEVTPKPGIPMFHQRLRTFPYRYGLPFVHQLRRLGENFELVDRAFRDLPQSTQQILHPERYLVNRWEPYEFSWPALPKVLGDWKLIEENTFGEYSIRVLLDQLQPEIDHAGLAAAWRGDRCRVYANGNGYAAIWHTLWDSEEAAADIAASLATIYPPAEGPRCTRVERDGKAVSVLIDAPSDAAEALWLAARNPVRSHFSRGGANRLTVDDYRYRVALMPTNRIDPLGVVFARGGGHDFQADFMSSVWRILCGPALGMR